MPTLFILCGIPACGKSYFAKYMFDNYNVIHISRDEIRFSLLKEGEDYFSHEKEVFRKFVGAIAQTLVNGFDCIADATHLNEFSRRKLTQAIDMYFQEYEIVYVIFNVDVDTCVRRNSAREGRANVPENIIRNMCRDYQAPTLEEDKCAREIIEV